MLSLCGTYLPYYDQAGISGTSYAATNSDAGGKQDTKTNNTADPEAPGETGDKTDPSKSEGNTPEDSKTEEPASPEPNDSTSKNDSESTSRDNKSSDDKKTEGTDTDKQNEAAPVSTAGRTLTVKYKNDYQITVKYDDKAGIPETAELKVSEIKSDAEGYSDYVDKTAEALGKDESKFAFARAFDITIADPETGTVYQPDNDVKVSIKLLKEEITEKSLLNVVHFPESHIDDGEAVGKAVVMDSEIKGESVMFETDGFSVYVVAKDELLKHFVFLNGTDHTSDIFSQQTLEAGEALVTPPDPTKDGAVFSHWALAPESETAYDFTDKVVRKHKDGVEDDEMTIPADATQESLDQDESKVYFYAVYKVVGEHGENLYNREKTIITFYNQSGLVVEKREVLKPNSETGSTYFNTRDVKYLPIQDKENAVYTFDYWTDDPRGTQAEVGDEGKVEIKNNTDTYIDLYPKLTETHYISFDANKESAGITGSVDFTPPVTVLNNSTGQEVADNISKIPTTSGYTLKGWYISSDDRNDSTTPAVFKLNSAGNGYDCNADEFRKLLVAGNLPNNPTLYAHWTRKTKEHYKIVVWRQKLTDDGKGVMTGDDAYAYAETFIMPEHSTKPDEPAELDDAVKSLETLDEYNSYNEKRDDPSNPGHHPANITDNKTQNPYYGFTLNTSKTEASKVVNPDGTTILNVYYDRKEFTLTFGTGQGSYSQDQDGAYYRNGNSYIGLGKTNEKYYRLYRNGNSYNDTRYYYIGNTRYSLGANEVLLYAGDDASGNALAYINGVKRNLYNNNDRYLQWQEYTGDRYSENLTVINRITAPYGVKIEGEFPIKNSSGTPYGDDQGQARWNDINKLEYTNVIAKILYMPGRNLKFKYDDGEDRPNKTLRYLAEALPGETGTKEYDGKQYKQFYWFTAKYRFITKNEDVYTFDGLNFVGSDPEFSEAGEIRDASEIFLFYDRKPYKIHFRDSNTQVFDDETVQFGSALKNYNTDKKPENTDFKRFSGWYLDPGCTTKVFFVKTEYDDYVAHMQEGDPRPALLTTMPAYDIILYAGWTILQNRIVLIPNGGEMPNGQSTAFYLDQNEKIEMNEPTRDYIEVDHGTGQYNYDPATGRYTEAAQNDGDYDAKNGAYTFQGWYEAVVNNNTVKEIERTDKPGKYARVYEDETAKRSGNEYLHSKTKYNLDVAPTTPVVLVALWQRAGGFRVEYDVKDSALPDLDYDGVTAPEDDNEYIDGAHALAQAPVNAPKGYTFDHWVDKQGNAIKPNELASITESNATPDDSEMIVTLKAVYREYNPAERTVADYTFKTNVNKSGGTDPFESDYYDYDIQRISVNEELKPPLTPNTPTGYVFMGWFYDRRGTRKFDGFGVISNPVYTTLYAVFRRQYTVTYYMTDNDNRKTGTVLATQKYRVPEGNEAPEKLDTRNVKHPVDLDHYPLRWIDDSGDHEYAYNTLTNISVDSTLMPASGNLELHADLKERMYVSFDSQGGSYVDTQEYFEGGWPTRPKEPKRDKYNFDGWYTQPEGGTLYEFNKPLSEVPGFDTRNPVLYAHWSMKPGAKEKITVIWWAETVEGEVNGKRNYELQDTVTLEGNLGEEVNLNGLNQLLDAANKPHYDNTSYMKKYTAAEQPFFEFSSGDSDTKVKIEDGAVFNVRFNRIRYTFKFKTNGSRNTVTDSSSVDYGNIIYNGTTYQTERTVQDVWYGKEISDIWPVVGRNGTTEANIDPVTNSSDESVKKGGRIWKYYEQNVVGDTKYHNVFGIAMTADATMIGSADNNKTVTFYMNAMNNDVDSTTILQYYPGKDRDDSLSSTQIGWSYAKSGTGQNIWDIDGDKYSDIFLMKNITGYKIVPDRNTAQTVGAKDNDNKPGFNVSNSAGRVLGRYNEKTDTVTVKETRYFATRKTTRQYYVREWYWYEWNYIPLNITLNEDGGSTEADSFTVTRSDSGDKVSSGTIWYSNGGSAASYNWNQFVNQEFTITSREVEVQKEVTTHYISFFYQKKTHKALLYLDDHTPYAAMPEVEIKYDEYVPDKLTNVPKPPAPEGMEFDCWSETLQASNPFNKNMPDNDIVLYARFKPIQHTVMTIGVAEDGTVFNANDDGDEIDSQDHPVPGGKKSKTYTANHGQMFKELAIPNPEDEGELFLGWVNLSESNITGGYQIKSDLKVRPTWNELKTHTITYDANVPAGAQHGGTCPTDNSRYVTGARAFIADGSSLYIKKKNVDGGDYDAYFAYWAEVDKDGKQTGNRYYSNTQYIFRKHSPSTLRLVAVYSGYRETTLRYDRNDDHQIDTQIINRTLKFIYDKENDPEQSEADYPDSKLDRNQVLVKFRDMLRSDYDEDKDKYPNKEYLIGSDMDKRAFKAVRTERVSGNGYDYTNEYAFGGWVNQPNDSLALAQNGDRAYINTIQEDSKNTLYALWGICKVEDKNGRMHLFDTIQKAVNFINTSSLITDKTGTVEMLIDYYMLNDQRYRVNVPAGCDVTLTTAKTGDGVYKYAGTGNATITRVLSGGSLFTVYGRLTLEDITLDGNKALFHSNESGGLVHVKNDGALTIGNGNKLENSKAEGMLGMLVHGPAIYLENGSKLYVSGNPKFGSGDRANTVSMPGYADKKNGGDSVYEGNLVRQDIYLNESGSGDPACIVVTSNITSGDGSIWVWASEDKRYKQTMPFAIADPDAVLNEDNLKAFRNARDDDTVENTTDTYLYGSFDGGDAEDNVSIIYWTGAKGGRKVVLRKVKGSGRTPQSGKTFNIYKGASRTAYRPKGQADRLSGLESQPSGIIWIGELTNGWYIIEEDNGENNPNKYFYVIVTNNAVCGTLNSNGSDMIGGYTDIGDAQQAAKAKYDVLK